MTIRAMKPRAYTQNSNAVDSSLMAIRVDLPK